MRPVLCDADNMLRLQQYATVKILCSLHRKSREAETVMFVLRRNCLDNNLYLFPMFDDFLNLEMGSKFLPYLIYL